MCLKQCLAPRNHYVNWGGCTPMTVVAIIKLIESRWPTQETTLIDKL